MFCPIFFIFLSASMGASLGRSLFISRYFWPNGAFTGRIDTGVFTGSFMLGYVGEWAGFQALFFAAGLVLLMGVGIHRLRPVDTG